MKHEQACAAIGLSEHRPSLLAGMRSWLDATDGRAAAGGHRWSWRYLLYVSVLASWSVPPTWRDRFSEAREQVAGMFAHGRRPGVSYQGYMAALEREGMRMLAWAREVLWQRMAQLLADCWRVEGWVALAVDGSRFVLPRTLDHEAGAGRSAHARCGPQLWLTTLWHLGIGVPWDWRVGPGGSDERGHLRRMLHRAPPGALLVMDSGFAKYALLQRIIAGGRHVLVRVGGNVTLLAREGERVRVEGGLVWLWPEHARRTGARPLVLRLIVLHDGRKAIEVVTSVLDAQALSDAQAAALYRRRWGVELFYRALKQTMQRRKLASRSLRRAKLELHGLVLGAMVLGLMTTQALCAAGHAATRASVATALRVLRQAKRRPAWTGWFRRLGDAITDRYRRRRSKSSRNYPRPKYGPPPGPPRCRTVTPLEVRCAMAFGIALATP